MTQPHTTLVSTAPVPSGTSLFDRIWPAAVIILALALNIAWVALLGYGLVSILGLAS
jgi:hypothetical protein